LCLALSIAPLAQRIIEFTLRAAGILLVGSAQALSTGTGRTVSRAILIGAITMTADKRLAMTAGALEYSGRNTHQQKG
jgi:hypothetical protein